MWLCMMLGMFDLTTPARWLVLGLAALLVATAPLIALTVGRQSAAVSGSTRAPVPGAAGIGDGYFPRDGNGGYQVQRYNVRIRYRLKSAELAGSTVIVAQAIQELSHLNVDFLLPVRRVRVNGRAARFSKPSRHELRITPRRTLAEGRRFTVKVWYAGKPDDVSYLGESNWLASRREVVTMNEPHMAPWWFPANDHPRDKARMRLHITVPRGKQVIANGQLVKKTRKPGLTTWHWRSSEPMAPYLAFFAAGDFEIRRGSTDGLPWLNAVSQRLSPAQQLRSFELLERTPEIDAWLVSEIGPYPFASTGGLVTSLKPGFALENQTRPTYPYLGPGGLSTVVHEQAHQWFGNDVSVDRWRDIWLSEGFATYFEVRYDETQGGGPSAEAWLRAQYDSRPAGDEFWDLLIARPGPADLFSAPVYLRGAMTLVALRNRIGAEDLQSLLRSWLDQRSRGNGSTEDFIASAEAISGADLAEFFDAWLFTGAKPAQTAANGLP